MSASIARANRLGLGWASFRRPPWPALFAIAISAWTLLLAFGHAPQGLAVCVDPRTWTAGVRLPDLGLLALLNPAPPLLAGWTLMSVATMAPTLGLPITHLWGRSLARMRWPMLATFVAGYLAPWIAAGVILIPAALILLNSGLPSWATALLGVLAAGGWQLTPAKRACLRACHRTPPLSAFGWAALGDSLRFGVVHGMACLGSCWALMCAPMLLSAGHDVAMMAVAAYVLFERLRCIRPPVLSRSVFNRLRQTPDGPVHDWSGIAGKRTPA